jgi:glycosyltransferase involved in cell wall biosynthesis
MALDSMHELWNILPQGHATWWRLNAGATAATYFASAGDPGLLNAPTPLPSDGSYDGLSNPGSEDLASGSGLQGKRVAMVSFSPYPFDPRPRRAADALLRAGMTVDYFCLWEDGYPRRELLNGINVFRLPVTRRRGGKFAYFYQYSAFILMSGGMLGLRSLRGRYDLVYVHNMPDVLVISSLIPRVLGAKVILDQHDPMPELMKTIFQLEQDSFSVRFIEKLEKWSIGWVDRVVTVNIACKRIFSKRSCRPEKISVVMNSPDESIFPFRPRPATPSSNQPASKPLKIMYHGSIVERNGLDVAVAAFAQVRKALPSAELRIYGTRTDFLDRVMEQVRALGLGECVHYFGQKSLEELVHEIGDCDVGIIPNQRNAFTDINTPTRIFEYLALGKPVIAPRTLGIEDYFDPQSLFFFEPGDARDLAQQIEYVNSHAQEADEVVRRGQQVYQSNRWYTQRRELVNLVSEVVNEGRKA